MTEIEVYLSLDGDTIRVGTLFRQAARGRESVTFHIMTLGCSTPRLFVRLPVMREKFWSGRWESNPPHELGKLG